jgi:hypothetical protein
MSQRQVKHFIPLTALYSSVIYHLCYIASILKASLNKQLTNKLYYITTSEQELYLKGN